MLIFLSEKAKAHTWQCRYHEPKLLFVKRSNEVKKNAIHRKINHSESRARFECHVANKMDDHSEYQQIKKMKYN